MKKLKIILIILVLTSMLFILTGCALESSTKGQERFIYIGNGIGDSATYVYYDKETKVQYIIGFKYGITVLVDAEGKPLLYEEE